VFLLWSLSACTCGPEADDPFVAAASHGDLSEVKESLKVHGDVERRNPVGVIALIAAARSGRTDVVDFLLGEGADVNARDYYDKTALEGAAAEVYWQVLVFVLAGLCQLLGVRDQIPAPDDVERRELASLLQPTDQDRRQSLSEIGKLFETHRSAVKLWQEAIYQLLDGKDPESVLSRLEAQAQRSPHFYDNYTRWLLSDFWRKTRGELIITAVGYGCTNENVLAGIDSLRQEPSADEDAARYSIDAKSLALILQADYSGAAKLMVGESRVFFEEEEKKIAAALGRLEQSPKDLGQRLELAESLISFARTGRFTVGFTSYCWDLWGEASSPEQRVTALSLLGRIYGRDEDQGMARMLYSAGMRLSSEMSAVDPDRQALLLERMANAECGAANYLVAASLYQKATEVSRDKSIWGTSRFNRGALLRKAGYGRAARKFCRD